MCLAGGLGLAAFVAVSLFGVVYPFTLEPYEGALLLPALKLSRGETIYGPEAFLKPPFLWTAYGPTYYFLTGMVMKVFGVAFWPGRLLSLFATLGTAAVVFFAVRHLCASRMAAIVSSSVFIMLPTTWTSGALSRVDALGLFLATTSFSLVLCSPDRWAFLAGGISTGRLLQPCAECRRSAAKLCCRPTRRRCR